MKRIGMLTSGGDCQALNAAMRGVVKGLSENVDELEIYGFHNGYKGLIYGDYRLLTSADFSGILTKGGTILGSSRQPFKQMRVPDENARLWYMNEAANESWSVRTLDRNISTQYYYRLLQSKDKDAVEHEMQEKTFEYQQDKLEFIKNPVVVEFLGWTLDASFNETKLESSIISNLQKFLMEMGKGYAFVARQQHIHTEKQDYFIDLVFYNYILKCFVLIDLKTTRITHQDVGQMDMYIRMYDELKKSPDDNPTLGIVLCSETDEDITRYSILHGNEQLFASKYKLYLPTEEELREEIEAQKAVFYLQQKETEKQNKEENPLLLQEAHAMQK